jgi:hypothetical protein
MNLDGDKLYTKLVGFDEIYIFEIQTFFIWSHLEAQKINIYGPPRFAPTAMGHRGSRLVLLNFEMTIYFCKMNKE